MILTIPEKAEKILSILHDAGFEAYVVGGCVRDSILGRTPNDWDITTSALPMQVKELFHHTVDTGLQHGTVTVLIGHEGFEVTTYRIDGEYEDGRHPKQVVFTSELAQDLCRRDFTINAMAYNHKEGLIDLFGGLQDIENHRIACVGAPIQRFSEDALRILRAVRFSAQLGYDIEEQTLLAMKELAGTLQKISAERIQAELVKLLVSEHPDYIRKAWECGITNVILPELDACMPFEQKHLHHCFTVGEHILHSLNYSRADKTLRLAMLLHDIGKPAAHTIDENGVDHFHGHPKISREMAHRILRRLKFDNATRERVELLVENHDRKIPETEKGVRRVLNKLGEEGFLQLLEVKYADVLAQSCYKRDEKLETLKNLKEIYDGIRERGDCVALKDLALTGSDLIAMGFEAGPGLGKILNNLLEIVLDDPTQNSREKLEALSEGMK